MTMNIFLFAIHNMLQRKTRTALTMVGVVIGIAAVVSLISLGSALSNTVEEQLEQLGPDRIFIVPKTLRTFGPPAGSETLDSRDLETVKSTQGVKEAVETFFRILPVKFKDEEKNVYLNGIPPKDAEKFFSDIQSFEIDQGRFMRENENGNVVLGALLHDGVFSENLNSRDRIAN